MPEHGQPGHGFADEILKQIITHWPQARHKFVAGNAVRFWKEIAAGKPVCSLVLDTPEHTKRASFTPVFLIPPLQLLTRRELLSQLPQNPSGEVRLPQLLRQHRLHGLLVKDRSYGDVLDSQLAHASADAGIQWLSTSSIGATLPKMLNRHRTDWSIGFDFVLAYLKSKDPALKDVISVPIEGASAPLVAGYACPRTEWGKATSKHIRQIISDPAMLAKARSGLEKFLTVENRRRYKAAFDRFYRQLRQTGPGGNSSRKR